MEIDLQKAKKVHFIGIGGIGISAIARLMVIQGKKVSGSDTSSSPITRELAQLGIKIFIGQKETNIQKGVDFVVYTIAVSKDNPELKSAISKKIPMATYPETLHFISKEMRTIAVSGTHGKTTTTAMLARVLIDAKLDPTVIVGSILKDYKSNLIVGKSDLFLVEACEYRRSFLNLNPKILVITNVDLDHLDYYKDLKDIQSAFRELAIRIPKDGALICNKKDERLRPIIKNLKCKIIDYLPYTKKNFKLRVLGNHNKQNAGASMAVARFLGIKDSAIKKSLAQFNGTWRRFDFKGKTKSGVLVYDDYAHHPKEITATLSGMKEMYPKVKRIAFFEPHLFSRTKMLLDEFANAWSDVDEVYVLPIFASREKPDSSISSEMLVKKILSKNKRAYYVKNFNEALKITNSLKTKTVVINIGAGGIYKLSELAVAK